MTTFTLTAEDYASLTEGDTRPLIQAREIAHARLGALAGHLRADAIRRRRPLPRCQVHIISPDFVVLEVVQ